MVTEGKRQEAKGKSDDQAAQVVVATVVDGRALIAADCRLDGEQVPQWTRMDDPAAVRVVLQRALAAVEQLLREGGRA